MVKKISTSEVKEVTEGQVLVRFQHKGRGIYQVMPCKDKAEAAEFMKGNGGQIVVAGDFDPNELIIVH